MPNDKQKKLLELRKKKNAKKQQAENNKHTEFVNAVNGLTELFGETSKDNLKALDELMKKLSEFSQFDDHLTRIEQAIEKIPKTDEVKITNLSEIVQQEVDLSEITKALEALAEEVRNQTPSTEVMVSNQKPDDYIPMRRVRKVGSRFIFDDDKMQVNVVGGGGGVVNNYSKDEANDVRFDPDETAPLYIGTHQTEGAPTSSTAWYISKFTRDGNGRATRIQRRKGSWDDRAIGW